MRASVGLSGAPIVAPILTSVGGKASSSASAAPPGTAIDVRIVELLSDDPHRAAPLVVFVRRGAAAGLIHRKSPERGPDIQAFNQQGMVG
jgi:hypothetical protein